VSLLSSTSSLKGVMDASTFTEDNLPPGIVKSILPCTPLAIVKSLEYVGVYNRLLDYGDRAYGRTVTVINRCDLPVSIRIACLLFT
jgi:methylenetetrahydrofolate dehydrogenase (NAD+)